MVEGVGVWYLYEITLWLHAGNLLRTTFRNHYSVTCCRQTGMDLEINNIIMKKLPTVVHRHRTPPGGIP